MAVRCSGCGYTAEWDEPVNHNCEREIDRRMAAVRRKREANRTPWHEALIFGARIVRRHLQLAWRRLRARARRYDSRNDPYRGEKPT